MTGHGWDPVTQLGICRIRWDAECCGCQNQANQEMLNWGSTASGELVCPERWREPGKDGRHGIGDHVFQESGALGEFSTIYVVWKRLRGWMDSWMR